MIRTLGTAAQRWSEWKAEGLEGPGDADGGLGLEVEVQVEGDAHVGPDGPPERAEVGLHVPQHVDRHRLVRGSRSPAEPREVDAGRVARVDDVGLEGAV